MVSVTARLAAHAAALRFGELPAEVVTVAKQCILDVLGVAIAGSAEPAAQLVRAAVLPESGPGDASLFGVPTRRTATGTAAIVNGTASHALDYDDVLTPMTGHPTAPVLPAVFAVAEVRRHSGRALLEAFVSGVETECRIGAAVQPSHYARGFHVTGTVGTFGAAAGVARLLEAEADVIERALGIAGAQAAGLKSQFGTMTKPLQAGKAAANGLLAARLAAQGFTSAADIVVVPQGFGATQADDVDLDVLSAPFGAPWYLSRTLFKMHASCHYTHSVFEALRGLAGSLPVNEIGKVILRVHPDLLSVCDIREPRTGLEAKFSMRFVAALALARGEAGPDQFTDDMVRVPRLRELCARVEVAPTDQIRPFTCECVVVSADGRWFSARHDSDRPAWRHSPDEQTAPLLEKYSALAAPVLGNRRAERLADHIMHLEDVVDVSAILDPAGR